MIEVTKEDATQEKPTAKTLSPPPTTEPESFVVDGYDGHETVFRGWRLGGSTSHTNEHRVHQTEFAPPKWRCGACRWFELTIYRVDVTSTNRRDPYLVHTRGVSVVPGERIFRRVSYGSSVYAVLQALTQWQGDRPTIPETSMRALEQAALLDDGIDKAIDAWMDATYAD